MSNTGASAVTVTVANASTGVYVYLTDLTTNFTYSANKNASNANAVGSSKTLNTLGSLVAWGYNANNDNTTVRNFSLSYAVGNSGFASYSVSLISMVAGVVFYAATL